MLAYLLKRVYMGFSVCVPTYVCFIFGVDFAIQIKVYRKILFYDLSKYTHSQHWRTFTIYLCYQYLGLEMGNSHEYACIACMFNII